MPKTDLIWKDYEVQELTSDPVLMGDYSNIQEFQERAFSKFPNRSPEAVRCKAWRIKNNYSRANNAGR